MEEQKSAALDARATVTGLVLRPWPTWKALWAAERRRNWVPVLAMVVLTGVLVFVSARADSHYRYRLALEWFEQRSEGQAPVLSALAFDATALRAASELGALALRWGLWTAALLLAGHILGGRRLARDEAVTLALWGWMPFIVRGLLQLGFVVATGTPVYNAGLSGLVFDATPPPLTAIRYVTPSAQQWAGAALLGGVDVFAGWQAVLTGWGLSAFTGVSRRNALVFTAAVWLATLPLHLLLG